MPATEEYVDLSLPIWNKILNNEVEETEVTYMFPRIDFESFPFGKESEGFI